MKSKTSFFNLTLLRKNTTRFSPIWICYLAACLLVVPVVLAANMLEDGAGYWSWVDVADYVGNVLETFGPAVAFVYGVILAMAVFSYLYTARSVSMLHSLPIRRSGLFLTNYVTGLLFILVPNAIVAVLTLLVAALGGAAAPGMIFTVFWMFSAMEIFFYSFATFIAMFTGHLLALPIFYVIYNFLVIGLYSCIYVFVAQFLLGISVGISPMSGLCGWATPLLRMYESVAMLTEYTKIVTEDGIRYGSPVLDVSMTGGSTLLVYLLLSVVLVVLAYAAYRYRHSETAGEVVSVGWAKVVFRYGVGITSAFTIGQGLYYLLFSGTNFAALEVLLMIVVGAVGFTVAQMLLNKSFRVLRKSLAGSGVCGAVVLVVLACGYFDITGTVRWVPEASQVQSVYVNFSGYTYNCAQLSDPESIAQTIALHKTILEHRNELPQGDAWLHQEGVTTTEEVCLRYTMQNGSTVFRDYTIQIQNSELGQEGSISQLATDLVNSKEYLMSWHIFDGETRDDYTPVSGVLTYYEDDKYNLTQEKTLSSKQLEAVYAALLEDAEAGRLPQINLLGDNVGAYYGNDLEIGYMTEYKNNRYTATILSESMTSTIAALEESGVLNDHVKLVSQDVVTAWYRDYYADYEGSYTIPAEYDSTITEEVDLTVSDTATNAVSYMVTEKL